MQIDFVTRGVPGAPRSEDLVVAGGAWLVVLDGATAMPARFATGCIHDVVWLVRHLGAHLASRLALEEDRPLTEILGAAIADTMADHAGTCDLSNPNSPSSTVSIVRAYADRIDCLALADSPVLVDLGQPDPLVLTDPSIEQLTDRSYEGVIRSRNIEGGFWVASTEPRAAEHAITGCYPRDQVRRIAVLTDGASRLVDTFGALSWAQLLGKLVRDGPAALIEATRQAERANVASSQLPLYKAHDDATAALLTLRPDQRLPTRAELRPVDGPESGTPA